MTPLSLAQQRLYFLERMGTEAPSYNLGAVLRITGPLDAGRLADALRSVVERHDVLWTRFPNIGPGGMPVQLADPSLRPRCELTDLSATPEPEAAARRIAVEQALARFDLASGPLLRCRLLRLAPDRHWLCLAVHHIVFDGWSAAILTRELAAAYAREPVPAPRQRFAEFAERQRGRPVSGGDLDVWRRLLAGAPATLDLPTDQPRPRFPSARGARVPVALGPELSRRVRSVAAASAATPFMVLLAAYGLVLGRRAGQERVVIGCPIANREPALEEVVGLFVDTLAVPLDAGRELTLRELVERTRRVCLAAYDHRELPFERLVEALDPPRHPGRNPVFQAAFAMQNLPRPRAERGGVRWELEWLDLGTAKFDLVLDVTDADGTFAGHLEYSTDLWERNTMSGLVADLAAVLETAPAIPR